MGEAEGGGHLTVIALLNILNIFFLDASVLA